MASIAGDSPTSPDPDVEDQDQDSDIMAEDKDDRASTDEKSPHQNSNDSKPASKSNAKDPSRPRRKKARRACYACQRAHLTCGDERPCSRCIKRGLAEQCHDGVRKKAKYLHDAPNEALMPGFAGNYRMNGSRQLSNNPVAPPMSGHGLPVSQPGNYFAQPQSGPYHHQYSPVGQQGPMPPPMIENSNMIPDYNVQGTPPQFQSSSSQQVSPVQDMPPTMDQSSALGTTGNPSFDSSFYDSTDPALFNFNISELNFGNHYGALEFGMLGHMSSGAVNTPDLDGMNSMAPQNSGSVSYDNSTSFMNSSFGYPQGGFQQWQGMPNMGSRQGSTNLWNMNNTMDAFAVTDASFVGASPHSQDQNFPGYSSSTVSPEMQFAQPDQTQSPDLLRTSVSQAQLRQKRPPFPSEVASGAQKKRRRDTSEIYTSVQKPYPYTQGFHALIEFLKARLPSNKVLRIAKSLASIRPSFISCNKNLNHDDLIFMEKCFQRTLLEYEDYLDHYGTPTIICRRTGEIAAVSKEFTLLTKWRRDVLLGKEPNLNVNKVSNSSGSQTGTSSKGTATPRVPNVQIDPGRPQPVFLAEVMDEDSVVQFYEHFSELAFGASRSSIIGVECSLLTYQTKDDPGWGVEDRMTEDGKHIKKKGDVKYEPPIKPESGIGTLGAIDGRVKSSMCWTVKRDMFDIPMLIVMNFLPVI